MARETGRGLGPNVRRQVRPEPFQKNGHEQTTLQGAANSGEATGCNLLEDRHHKADRATFAALLRCQVVSLAQVGQQFIVEDPLRVG